MVMQQRQPRANSTVEEMGPIDYVVIEWPDRQPNGSALPMLIDLVDRGVVHVLDIAFIRKDSADEVTVVEIHDLDDTFRIFEGARSGLLDHEDLMTAADVLAPGTSAAVLVWENSWAEPFVTALRHSGAQLAASGRIPVQGILAALEADAATES